MRDFWRDHGRVFGVRATVTAQPGDYRADL